MLNPHIALADPVEAQKTAASRCPLVTGTTNDHKYGISGLLDTPNPMFTPLIFSMNEHHWASEVRRLTTIGTPGMFRGNRIAGGGNNALQVDRVMLFADNQHSLMQRLRIPDLTL